MNMREHPGTPEQVWCGDWWDCTHPGCRASALDPSPALRDHLATQAAATDQLALPIA
jgi:hypothetical protein